MCGGFSIGGLMSLNFGKIKRIRIVEVCGRYQISLKFRGDYANAQCPLPNHKEGDKANSFSINLAGNYWRDASPESCNAKNNGKKGGDVINFVALMENCREKEAAEKLAQWYGVGEIKTPVRMEQGSQPKQTTNLKNYPDDTKPSDSVKYMTSVLNCGSMETWKRRDGESDADYRKRLLTAESRLFFHQSYKAGQKSKAA